MCSSTWIPVSAARRWPQPSPETASTRRAGVARTLSTFMPRFRPQPTYMPSICSANAAASRAARPPAASQPRSEVHTSELHLLRLLVYKQLIKKKKNTTSELNGMRNDTQGGEDEVRGD